MLDIKFIRENPKKVKEACKKRQVKIDIEELLKIDKEKRENLQKIEKIRAEKNKASKKITATKDKKEKQKIISEMKKIDKKGDKIEKDLKKLENKVQETMYKIPNMPFDDVPIGKDESGNVVMRQVTASGKLCSPGQGKKTKFDFKPKDYLEIAENLDLIDVKRAAKVSGSRFGYLKNKAALLEFALINFALDVIVKKGFIPIIPPVLIKSEAMCAMGYIDTKEDLAERYFFEKDNLFLVGTSEQSIGPMHKDEIFSEKDLPKRYLSFSTCFREEAGSYGKDTRGILRVHQFDKLEMFIFSQPENSQKEHQLLIKIEEELMKSLKLPYRLVHLCTGDSARPSASTFDIETWFPTQNKYRETHSASNCTDFQARRLNIKYRDKNNKLNFVHTLNGTAFAIGRMLIAIIENYQQKNGSIKVPDALQKYTGFKEIKK